MKTSENVEQVVEALAAASGEFLPVVKERDATIVSQKGSSFGYSYATLGTAVTATRPALAKHGLVVIQPARLVRARTRDDIDEIEVTSVLYHKSGQWISEVCTWPVSSTDNRSIGSGMTYARRHSYLALLGIAAEDDDDDGERARGGNHETHAVERQVRGRAQRQVQAAVATKQLPAKDPAAVAVRAAALAVLEGIAKQYARLGIEDEAARKAMTAKILGHRPANQDELKMLLVALEALPAPSGTAPLAAGALALDLPWCFKFLDAVDECATGEALDALIVESRAKLDTVAQADDVAARGLEAYTLRTGAAFLGHSDAGLDDEQRAALAWIENQREHGASPEERAA